MTAMVQTVYLLTPNICFINQEVKELFGKAYIFTVGIFLIVFKEGLRAVLSLLNDQPGSVLALELTVSLYCLP